MRSRFRIASTHGGAPRALMRIIPNRALHRL